MSDTLLREKNQITLPGDAVEAAGLNPGDRIAWRFEGGEIRGRKMVPETVEVLDIGDVDPKTLLPKGSKGFTVKSILEAIRTDRDR